ncbi:unnamed protein product [Brassica rapa subsp. narinosa]
MGSRWSRVRALSSPPPFKFQKEAVSRYLPFRCSAANPSVRYLRDGTGTEPYNLRFHQPVLHLLFISWLICVGWDSQGHALPSSGVDSVWSRFHWVSMAQGLVSLASPVAPVGVAFGMVCGSLDHSPVESSIDLCCLMQVPASCLFRDLLKLNVCSWYIQLSSFGHIL